jgi:hypothetical protein
MLMHVTLTQTEEDEFPRGTDAFDGMLESLVRKRRGACWRRRSISLLLPSAHNAS